MNATEMLLEQHEIESKTMQQQLVNLITQQQAKVEPPKPTNVTPKSASATQPGQTPTLIPVPESGGQFTDVIGSEDEEVKKLKIRHTLEMMQLQFEKDKLQRQQELVSYKETLDKQKIEAQQKEQEKIYQEKVIFFTFEMGKAFITKLT